MRPAVYHMSARDVEADLQRCQHHKHTDLLSPVYICDPSQPDFESADDHCQVCDEVFGPQSLVDGPGCRYSDLESTSVCSDCSSSCYGSDYCARRMARGPDRTVATCDCCLGRDLSYPKHWPNVPLAHSSLCNQETITCDPHSGYALALPFHREDGGPVVSASCGASLSNVCVLGASFPPSSNVPGPTEIGAGSASLSLQFRCKDRTRLNVLLFT